MIQETVAGDVGITMRSAFRQRILALADRYGPSDTLERLYDDTCSSELNARVEYGEAQRIAEERGISERDTILEIALELREPYRRIKYSHARQQWEAYDRKVAQLESINSIASIRAYAKEHGVSVADALETLTPTPPPLPRPPSRPLDYLSG
ncbi:MAG: hypothetical protein JOZ19_00805 [Rubrobacter sp.]|nr:hypothetical protein [Rubrobacter sp.]